MRGGVTEGGVWPGGGSVCTRIILTVLIQIFGRAITRTCAVCAWALLYVGRRTMLRNLCVKKEIIKMSKTAAKLLNFRFATANLE